MFVPRPVTEQEIHALDEAFDAAHDGPLDTANPRVGCVLMSADGLTSVVGWHKGAGTPHAEAMALAVARSTGFKLHGSTAFVTLEPCAHHGRTPPCAVALIEAGVRRVIYSYPDASPLGGGGAALLRRAGVEVLGGINYQRGKELIFSWLDNAPHDVDPQQWVPQRPYVIAKWAMSLDGRIAAADGTSTWITGEQARAYAHTIRSTVDAIAVGSGTFHTDDPLLTVRDTPEQAHPLRVVVGNRPVSEGSRACSAGASLLHVPTRDLPCFVETLSHNSVRRVLVDGGPTLVSALIAEQLVDELHVYVAPKLLGAGKSAFDDAGVTTLTAAHHFSVVETQRLGEDVFIRLVATTDLGDAS